MTLLDKHIGSYVIWGTMLALLVLLALLSFTEFVDDLDSVGKGAYTLGRAIEYLLLTTPRRVFDLFPSAALVGSLVGLGVLSSNSELIVVRAAGVSLARITASVMKAGMVLMLIALIVGEVIAPIADALAHERRTAALADQIATRSGRGFWVRDGSSFISIGRVLRNDRMADIHIYEFDESHRLRVSAHAADAYYRDGQWLLRDIVQSNVDEQRVTTRRLAKAAWTSLFKPELVNVITVKPRSLSAIGLYRHLRYLKENALSTARYELALWSKLFSPLSTGVMIFLAIPLVLGKLRSTGIGQRLLIGILVGIGFHVIQKTAASMGIVYGLTPLLSASAPTVLFFLVALWLSRQVP